MANCVLALGFEKMERGSLTAKVHRYYVNNGLQPDTCYRFQQDMLYVTMYSNQPGFQGSYKVQCVIIAYGYCARVPVFS